MFGNGTAQILPATQILIALIPIIGIVLGSVVIFFFLLWRHREVVRQIETGSYRKPSFDIYLFSLLAGFLLSGVGFVVSVLFLSIEGKSYSLLGGLIPFACGISLLAFYFLTRPDKNRN
jgi:hypothetical protein